MITKNGRPCAALVPITEDTDLEALALSQNKRFWKLIDNAIARGKKEGFVDLTDLWCAAKRSNLLRPDKKYNESCRRVLARVARAHDTDTPMRPIRLLAVAALLATVSIAHAANTGNLKLDVMGDDGAGAKILRM